MAVERERECSLGIYDGRTLIAESTSSPGSPALEIPGQGSRAEVLAAAGRARYYTDPVFPDCFVCGMGRRPGDGLRIIPGPLAGLRLWVAPWTPDVGPGGQVLAAGRTVLLTVPRRVPALAAKDRRNPD
jgi:hypothetical protein